MEVLRRGLIMPRCHLRSLLTHLRSLLTHLCSLLTHLRSLLIRLRSLLIRLRSLLIRLRSLLIRRRSLFIGLCRRYRLLRPVGRPVVLPGHGIWSLREFWRCFVFWLPISTSGAVWEWQPLW